MKVNVKTEEPEFKPVVLSFVLETPEEVQKWANMMDYGGFNKYFGLRDGDRLEFHNKTNVLSDGIFTPGWKAILAAFK